MPDFGPYLIFCLYLSRMQKYAFFSRLCKHSRGNPSPARLFLAFRPGWGVSAFLQTKRGRKGKNVLSGGALFTKKEVLV